MYFSLDLLQAIFLPAGRYFKKTVKQKHVGNKWADYISQHLIDKDRLPKREKKTPLVSERP